MRSLGWLAIAIAVAALVLSANRKLRHTAPDAPDDASAAIPAGDSVQFSESIEARQQVTLARLLEKDRTVKALLRGELTLDETAARFRALNCEDPVTLATLQNWYDSTGDEIHYWNVLMFARGAAQEEPEELGRVWQRVEAEVLRRFPRHPRAFP